MKVYPTPIEVGDTEGFSPGKDLFNRAELGAGLTNLVTVVEDPMVIAFDGAWGSGKSTFLRMWAGELRKAKFPVIVFDAFENDYVDDAFAALAREIVELSEQSKTAGSQLAENVKDRAVELGSMLLRSAGKIAINVGVRAATAGLVSGKDLADVASDVEDEAAEIADKYMEDLLSRPAEQKLTVQRFREALSSLPSALQEVGATSKPLIFIIDELDRCKPIFALSVLERIKHFMSVPNVHFVLGVHLRQLEASVRAVYGSDINAPAYLEKFINLTVSNVDTAERAESRQLKVYGEHLRRALAIPLDDDSPLPRATATLVRVLEQRGAGFRTMERAFTVLALAIAFTPTNYVRYGVLVGGLIALKLFEPKLFTKAKAGTLSLSEALSGLGIADDHQLDRHGQHEAELWTFCLAEVVPAEIESRFSEYSWHLTDAAERRGLITHTANQIVDRLR